MEHQKPSRETWIAAAIMPLLLAALYPLQVRIDARTRTIDQEKEELLLRSGKLLHRLSLGYDSLLADIYWTRAVQYYGDRVGHKNVPFDLLSPLLELTTTLDPHLLVAYKFGAVFLAEPQPIGANRPELAVDLVRRGIAANPNEWSLWASLGFIDYWYLKDYKQAAAAYLEGSKDPNALPWMKGMAAKIEEEGGSRQASHFLWSQIYESSREPDIRKNALEHLQALDAEADAEQLEKLSVEFHERFGRFPHSERDLVTAGMIPGQPIDPAGYPYRFDSEGKVRLDARSPLHSDVLKPLLSR
jgi:hypothetical protein